jgi:hypothetical protein
LNEISVKLQFFVAIERVINTRLQLSLMYCILTGHAGKDDAGICSRTGNLRPEALRGIRLRTVGQGATIFVEPTWKNQGKCSFIAGEALLCDSTIGNWYNNILQFS